MNEVLKEENQNIKSLFDNIMLRDIDQSDPNFKRLKMLKFCKENSAKKFEDKTKQFLNSGKLNVLKYCFSTLLNILSINVLNTKLVFNI